MIELHSVSKYYGHGKRRAWVLREVNAAFKPGRHYVIFGRRHSGKTTLLGIVGGTVPVSHGVVMRSGLVSPIVGAGSVLTSGRTALDLVRIYAKLYRLDFSDYRGFVHAFGGVHGLLHKPVLKLPPEIRRSLAYALSYGVAADWFLFDGNAGPSGNTALAEWCARAFEYRMSSGSTIYMTATSRNARRFGDAGGIVHNGRLQLYDELDEAIEVFERMEGLKERAPVSNPSVRKGRPREITNQMPHPGDNPADILARKNLAKDLLGAGNVADAISSLKQLESSGSLDVEATYLLTRLYEQAGDWPLAISYATKLLVISPNHKGAVLTLARSLERLGKFEEAIEYWNALAAGSEKTSDYLPAFRNYVKQRKWAAALETIDAALSIGKPDPSLMSLKLRVLLELKRYREFKELLLPLAVLDTTKAMSLLSPTIHRLDLRTLAELIQALDALGIIDKMDELTKERAGRTLDRYRRSSAQRHDDEVTAHITGVTRILTGRI